MNLNISTSSADFNWTLVLIIVGILVVALLVVAFTPKFRDPIVNVVRTTWGKVGPLLSSPHRLIAVIAANLLVQLLFSLTSYTILRAFGQDVGFADVILVNECVALFAGLMPVPGGVGVTEAALDGRLHGDRRRQRDRDGCRPLLPTDHVLHPAVLRVLRHALPAPATPVVAAHTTSGTRAPLRSIP